MNIKDLNCVKCGQNVMINGLKSHKSQWKCRSCIKFEGVDLTTANAILVYDTPTTSLKLDYKTKDILLKEVGY